MDATTPIGPRGFKKLSDQSLKNAGLQTPAHSCHAAGRLLFGGRWLDGSRRSQMRGRANQLVQSPPSGVFSLTVVAALDDRVGDLHDPLHGRSDEISIA